MTTRTEKPGAGGVGTTHFAEAGVQVARSKDVYTASVLDIENLEGTCQGAGAAGAESCRFYFTERTYFEIVAG